MTEASSEIPTVVDALPPHVLVVDDDPTVCRFLVAALSRWGYLVLTARTLGEARAALGARMPDVLVVDVELGSENGLDLIGQLPTGRRPVILACTGNPDFAPGDLPIDHVMREPLDLLSLIEVVNGFSRRRRRAA